MRHLMPLLVAAALVLSTTAAYADLGDQLFKLLPEDPAPTTFFGSTVEINGTTAIVGTFFGGSGYLFDTTTGQQLHKLVPGAGAVSSVAISATTAIIGTIPFFGGFGFAAAYVFDTTTGQQLLELVPENGTVGDAFGRSVAITGTTTIVGAPTSDGSIPGAAFLFDTTTGQQLFKLLPDDSAIGDAFGWSVAITGTIAFVGAPTVNTVYLFDTSTGLQISKLLAEDGAEGDSFGGSVAVSGTTAIVGARDDDDMGSAYLFDTSTSQQIAKLLPNPGVVNDCFGISVAINETTAIVGAPGDLGITDDNINSVYLFDTTTFLQIAKLLPDDNAPNDAFGVSVASSTTTAIVGAMLDDDNGDVSGAAYLLAIDTDGDGLRDDWETPGGGIPYLDSGGIERRYVLDIDGDGVTDADPLHKDLFVEVDIMKTVPFSSDAMGTVMGAFANAPVDNPDGDTGINLHIDWPNAHMIEFDEMWGADFVEFDLAKESFFGTPSERSDANWEHIKAAKKRAFRYCIFANRMEVLNDPDSHPMGIAELPGNDFFITLGGIVNLEERVIASTFMHEFGHNLNLHHGGVDDITYKPNYVSVMNYNFDCLVYENLMPLSIDFSRESLLPLNEFDLDETIGIQSIEYSNVLMYHGYQLPGQPTQIDWVQLNTPNYDWNHDDLQEQGVHADLNWLDPKDDDSPGEVMNSYNDWDLIVLPVGTDGDYADLVHDTVGYPEIDEETFHWLRENVPPPPGACLADFDGDGAIGPFDLAFVLGHWGPNPGHPADLDGDGEVGPFDLALVLGNWGPCE